jgi:hypothetical protein
MLLNKSHTIHTFDSRRANTTRTRIFVRRRRERRIETVVDILAGGGLTRFSGRGLCRELIWGAGEYNCDLCAWKDWEGSSRTRSLVIAEGGMRKGAFLLKVG